MIHVCEMTHQLASALQCLKGFFFFSPPWDWRNNKKNCTETKHELPMDGFTKQLTQEYE